MKKLIQGIVAFRQNVRPNYREKFAQLALGQAPDTLFIACSDSRVVPNLFASTDPGDLFVIRNVGNLIGPAASTGYQQVRRRRQPPSSSRSAICQSRTSLYAATPSAAPCARC